ncbi:MAG: rane fusion protein heavy metal efflux system, partial [Chloroflexota bacterium]|nr:rane fusion protein heavy metal efflux system [Chloroflexota bacterium]
GQIEANTNLRVEIRPRASGVVREVRVVLGQKVKPGDVLVVLDSPDVGTARLNLHGRQRELVTARTEAAWKNEVASNVARMIPELRAGTPAQTIANRYADRSLGAFRAMLIETYTNFELASHEAEKQTGLHREKIVGEHPWVIAVHSRESAQAKFEATLEQVRFDANQQKLIADQQVKNAEAAVIDAAQRLRILGVAEDIDKRLAHPEMAISGSTDEDLTAYSIVAPFEGTIITRNAVPSQKAEMNDILFTLADLSTVWVVANLNESDFGFLHALPGGTVHLGATAYPGRSFEARLLSIGAVVDPTTRTVPILAETPNPDDMFKLGMFVRISLDSATTEEVLTVPAAAVVEVEGKKGVFRPADPGAGKDGHTYTFHRVKIGRESGDRQVVLSGLSKGESVVSAGAFFLKSELILQNETEED